MSASKLTQKRPRNRSGRAVTTRKGSRREFRALSLSARFPSPGPLQLLAAVPLAYVRGSELL